MATPSDPQTVLGWMQARLVELLLRYDAARFASLISEREGGPLGDPRLEPYRRLAALWHLRGELFEGILPLIKRRLSFVAPRELLSEGLPPRGRVDWPRTLAAGLRDAPGEAPLEARTRQRRRHFATPENLLVVVTLLEYRAAAERALETEAAQAGLAALRHPFHEIVDACGRELAFPQLAGLVGQCERIVGGDAEGTIEDLEQAVAEQLPPGSSGAYEDLLAWRRRLAALTLVAHYLPQERRYTLGSDPGSDDLLYRTWLFLEVADLLRLRGQLPPGAVSDTLHLAWGEGAGRRAYVLRLGPALESRWASGPAPQPALLIAREGCAVVRDREALVWREPGFVVAAHIGAGSTLGDATRRLLGDMALLGERRGAVVFAVAAGATEGGPAAPYQIAANLGASDPDAAVLVHQVAPVLGDTRGPQAALEQLLDAAHAAIGPAVSIACHGVFLDEVSATEGQALAVRDGAPLAAEPGDLLVCPKPHIGPWRVDLVSRSRHCCQDARLCHITGRPGARRPVRPPRTTEDLLRELDALFERRAPDAIDEAAIDAVGRRVEALTRRFAELSGALALMDVYEQRLRDMGMARTLDRLAPEGRESLALAVYLVEKLDAAQATDFSAPMIHIARVLEREIQRRVMAIPGIAPADFPHGKPTLGALDGTRRKRPEVWARIEAHLAGAWDGRVDDADEVFNIPFDSFVKQLHPIVNARNQAAHTTPLARERYSRLFGDVCHGGASRVGVLNALLLAWPAGASDE
ncbi:MAG: hypothetical protein HGA45_11545 [Chloroflexales bacterium]|nr:hypothetical protein [Chloroflexales bacterium]